MADHSQFLARLSNRTNPIISLNDLIIELTTYTNKTNAFIADQLENLIFDFRKGGSNNQYDNAFVYCTVFEKDRQGQTHSYAPMTNYFKDTFNHIKSYLNEVIATNNHNLELIRFGVKGSEIARLIKSKKPNLLDKAQPTTTETISQIQADYISVYELIEWARQKSGSDINFACEQLLEHFKEKQIQTYKRSILTDKITKIDTDLLIMLQEAKSYNSYDCDIPF